MVNVILAIDDEDTILGEFYTECLNDLENFENDRCAITSLRSRRLNDLAISVSVPRDSKFVFMAYSHGSDSELLVGGMRPYISETSDLTLFKGSFFYTCSCNTGKRLGHSLINHECISYIGYKEKFEIWDFNRAPFVECANYGYKLFVQGENVQTILEQMKGKYDEKIDNYTNDYFGAVHLLANRNALLGLGDLTYSIDSILNT